MPTSARSVGEGFQSQWVKVKDTGSTAPLRRRYSWWPRVSRKADMVAYRGNWVQRTRFHGESCECCSCWRIRHISLIVDSVRMGKVSSPVLADRGVLGRGGMGEWGAKGPVSAKGDGSRNSQAYMDGHALFACYSFRTLAASHRTTEAGNMVEIGCPCHTYTTGQVLDGPRLVDCHGSGQSLCQGLRRCSVPGVPRGRQPLRRFIG